MKINLATIISLCTLLSMFVGSMAWLDTKIKGHVFEGTRDVMEFNKDVLDVEQSVVKRQIEKYEEAGEPVPDDLRYQRDAFEDLEEEINRKWLN